MKGLKGLDRYFKQIAQSARAGASGSSSGDVDDFLGSVNVQLDELASSGLDKWFELDGRSEHKKAEGRIRLRLKLATREDRGMSVTSEEDNFNDLKQHEHILEKFVRYELDRRQFMVSGGGGGGQKNSDWSGELSREAETILHQHAIQGDLTDFQIALWYIFRIFSSRSRDSTFFDDQFSYAFVCCYLKSMDSLQQDTSRERALLQDLA